MHFWNRSVLRASWVCALLCTWMALGNVAVAQVAQPTTTTASPANAPLNVPAPAAGHVGTNPSGGAGANTAQIADAVNKPKEGERDLSWLPADLLPKLINATTSSNSTGSAKATESADPVLKFLNDKGLLPSAKPVVDIAQQVRSRATDVASDLVVSAMSLLGVPYRRGGTSAETGFDCSGFTRHVFENTVGLILPRRAAEQANSPDLQPVPRAELKPGDLVFFNTLRNTFSHVGIYIGDNKFIHSPRAGAKVRVEDLREAYWQQRYDGARRAPGLAGTRAATAANAAANAANH